MIVPMRKTYVVSRREDRQRLLTSLRDLGVMHVEPVDPSSAVAEQSMLTKIDQLQRALQIIASHEPSDKKPNISGVDAAAEILEIQRRNAENHSRLTLLYQQVEEMDVWGDVKLEDFQRIKEAGLELRFFEVDESEISEVKADLVQTIRETAKNRVLVAAVCKGGEVEAPESAEVVELPEKDRPTLKAQAGEIDKQLKEDAARLDQLANCTEDMNAELIRLRENAEFTLTERGGLDDKHLFAVQGWVPEKIAGDLHNKLGQLGIYAGVESREPLEDETPPTLIEYPWWSKPIKALFDILGTLPGYREIDLSPFFMIALPVFAAMLIGDAGYGMVFTLAGVIFYKKISQSAGKPAAHLLITMGVVTLVYGILSANIFGITPDSFRNAQGDIVGFGAIMQSVAPLWSADSEAARMLVVKISFIIATIHLTLAHIRQVIAFAPSQKAVSEVGWSMVLLGMLGVVWRLFKQGLPEYFKISDTLFHGSLILVGAGLLLAILFTHPSRNIVKRVGIGFASSLLPLMSAFSDTMSYIRLMAVGMASYYIADAFNTLGSQVADVATWGFGTPVVLGGHALNIALAIIAIFAHGVRLNMLEFSNNAGVQWAGHKYQPFSKAS